MNPIIASLPKNMTIKAGFIFDNIDRTIILKDSNDKKYYLNNLHNNKLKEVFNANACCNKCKKKVTTIRLQITGSNVSILHFHTQGGKLTKDHIFPKSYGGLLTKNNKQYLCNKCNSKKGNKILEPFLEQPIIFIIAITETIYHRLKYKFNTFQCELNKL